ncbi:unnamed protein product, partial [Rotaria sordida]
FIELDLLVQLLLIRVNCS